MKQSSKKEFPSIWNGAKKETKRLGVILAGGDGSRLKTLTRAIAGDERPKQFCAFTENESLLQRTRGRVAMSIRTENTYYSLTQKHETFYRDQLWDVCETQTIVQPENKGTAPAILYSLLRIARRHPDATVAFFPSDHFFSDDRAFMRYVEGAFAVAERDPSAVVLLGIEPEKPETSYGWIEPEESLFGDMVGAVSRVKRFWEKPSYHKAKELVSMRCLWNSFVMVGSVSAFLKMFRRFLPDMYRMFAASSATLDTGNERAVIRSLYNWIDETNFSSEVLEKASDSLLVLRVGDVGWSDWGEPQRVLGSLAAIGIQPDWVQAMAA